MRRKCDRDIELRVIVGTYVNVALHALISGQTVPKQA